MRLGIFGGTFDPIHLGHLLLAERCREDARLDQVWFMPCAANPLKDQSPRATNRQRVEMVELALGGHEAFVLSRIELDRQGPSYTVDSLRTIRQQCPEDELFLIMGDDSLESFAQWREPKEICQLATPLVVARPGHGDVDLSALKPWADSETYARIAKLQMTAPQMEISSTDIRHRVAEGKSIRFLTPRSVEKYIETQKLYHA